MIDIKKRKEYRKKHYIENRDKYIKEAKLWDLNFKKLHPVEWKERWKKYRMRDKEKVLNNPDKLEKRKKGKKISYNKRLEYNRKYAREKHRRYKLKVFEHYGMKCSCCGESIYEFLTVDHINNDGAEHRKVIGTGGTSMYYWLVHNNFPEGFQTLCWNCNCGKRMNTGICPHKKEEIDYVFKFC